MTIKNIIISLNLVSPLLLFSQSTYCIYKDDTGITFGKLNNINGTYTALTNTICNSSYWSAIDQINGHFIFKGQEFANQSVSKLYTLDINNGNILSSISVTGGNEGIKNMEYSLFDSTLYTLHQNTNGITFGKLDNISGTYTPLTNTICNSVYWSTIDQVNGHFIFKGQEFANQSVSKLYTLDINNGNILSSVSVIGGNEGIRNLEYNPCDSTLYALYQSANGITFGKLDNISGTYTTLTNTICHSVYWSTLDPINGHYIFKGQEFANQSVSKLYTLDINDGNIIKSESVIGGIIAIRNMESIGTCYNDECQKMIDIPNVFTPNNDGVNDLFHLNNISCFSQAQLTIYNRWGTKIFETDDLQIEWDGLNAIDGVYFWSLSYKNSKNEQLLRQGFLTLIK